MQFYLIAALLTLAMLAVVFRPVLRARHRAAGGTEHEFDLTLYKDQLREVDADLERGAISPEQAEYARAEIGRRLIAAQDAATNEAKSTGVRRTGGPVLIASALFVPAVAALVYSMTGSPGMEAQPLAARIEERQRQVAENGLSGLSAEQLIARAEQHLEDNPQDARGWEVLGPMYLRMGRAEDAAQAFKQAMVLLGENAARQSGLGQAEYMLAQGAVSEEAKRAFERALELEPRDSRARFFLALAEVGSSNVDGAVSQWRALAADDAAKPEWRAAAREGLSRYDTQLASAPEARAPALDAETMQDAESMTAEDRQAMISNMVAGLDARLRENPDDLSGWQRLIRSYVVLGRSQDAEDAVSRAVAAFSGDEAVQNQIRGFAAALDVAVGENEGQ